MNWTTTLVPMWQIDCDQFRKVGRPFELRDIRTPEHEEFTKAFAQLHNLKLTRTLDKALFEPT